MGIVFVAFVTIAPFFDFYRLSTLKAMLANTSTFFISHKHPDHHCGLITLLLKRQQVQFFPQFNSYPSVPRRSLTSPRTATHFRSLLIPWLFGWIVLPPSSASLLSIFLESFFVWRPHVRSLSTPSNLPSKLRILSFRLLLEKSRPRFGPYVACDPWSSSFALFHRFYRVGGAGAVATKFVWQDGFSVVFSGDTRPSLSLTRFGSHRYVLG